MLTLFTTAKAFEGHSGVIQRNALQSWKLLGPEVEVILFGDDRGAAEVCAELGINFQPQAERHESGFKYLDYIFDRAQQIARYDVLCYSNCDIVLGPDFGKAVEKLLKLRQKYLLIGRRWDTDVKDAIDFCSPEWFATVRERALQQNRPSDDWYLDYFVFRRGLFLGRIPGLVIGRIYWDNWLVWFASHNGATIIDGTSAFVAIHQNHDYSYHKHGKAGIWNDELTLRNLQLAGGREHLYSIRQAEHQLTTSGVRLKPRLTEWVKYAKSDWRNHIWHPFLKWSRPLRHAVGIRAHPVRSGKKEEKAGE